MEDFKTAKINGSLTFKDNLMAFIDNREIFNRVGDVLLSDKELDVNSLIIKIHSTYYVLVSNVTFGELMAKEFLLIGDRKFLCTSKFQLNGKDIIVDIM